MSSQIRGTTGWNYAKFSISNLVAKLPEPGSMLWQTDDRILAGPPMTGFMWCTHQAWQRQRLTFSLSGVAAAGAQRAHAATGSIPPFRIHALLRLRSRLARSCSCSQSLAFRTVSPCTLAPPPRTASALEICCDATACRLSAFHALPHAHAGAVDDEPSQHIGKSSMP